MIEYVRKELPHKTTKIFQTKESELVFSKITIINIKWLVVSIYRPPNDSNINKSFAEWGKIRTRKNAVFGHFSRSDALKNYEICIIMGDFNFDMDNPDLPVCAQLIDFCDIFDLANMINEKTCFRNHSSRIDLILSNKPSSFQLFHATETGLSECHKLITTCMKAIISRLTPKVIHYRNYKKFDERNFLSDIHQEHFECKSSDLNENWIFCTKTKNCKQSCFFKMQNF